MSAVLGWTAPTASMCQNEVVGSQTGGRPWKSLSEWVWTRLSKSSSCMVSTQRRSRCFAKAAAQGDDGLLPADRADGGGDRGLWRRAPLGPHAAGVRPSGEAAAAAIRQ